MVAVGRGRAPADGVGKAGRGGDVFLPVPDSRVDGGGEMVAVAGAPDHRREADVVELPPEERGIEPDGSGRVAGVQIAEVPPARPVGELVFQPPPPLPQTEAGTPWIDQGLH